MITIDCQGKKALVCGSTQGIGKAIAVKLAEAGATVTLAARNEDSLKAVCAELPRPAKQQHDYIVADFSIASHVQSSIEEYLQAHKERQKNK